MKIKLYLEGYRTRHGGDGVIAHYTEKDRIESVLSTLDFEGDDLEPIEALIAEGKYGEAFDLIWETDDGCAGHEFYIEEVVIDTDKAEVVS